MAESTTNCRILITGECGQVGEALRRTLAPLGEIYSPTLDVLDLTDTDSIRKIVREFHPRWIVNAAAHTAVDKAESEPDLAFAINATAPKVLAEEARSLGAGMVHYSTDYVFNGTKKTPYVESDATGPLNVYGSSKLAGEQAIAASGAAYLTFRTSWVYGATGNNFVRSMLRLAAEREHLRIVGDQYGAPTWSFELAQLTAHAIAHTEQLAAQSHCSLVEAMLPLSGLYHATGAGETTWHGFAAQTISGWQKRKPELKLATVEAITTAEYPTAAKRPVNSLLDCSKLAATFGWHMMDWKDSLTRVLDELDA
ncbi:MAG: dTDP-4-dehydrorhamnose reductase [Acidobacteriaceae bacterium]|nr:dTDP-4-dehydrorhamnose reductase [Acidobacteriaceae bacterium]